MYNMNKFLERRTDLSNGNIRYEFIVLRNSLKVKALLKF